MLRDKKTGLAYRTPTPRHHVGVLQVPLNSGMCDVALSSTQQHDDHVDRQHKNANHETSMRPLVHTTGQPLWTDVGLSTTRHEQERDDKMMDHLVAVFSC